MNLILIDTSFFCFYRYGATSSWYCLQNKKEKKENCNIENKDFLKYYDIQFRNTINKIIKHYKTENIIWILDEHRNNVWRMKHDDTYKSGREGIPYIADFMKYSYENIICDYKNMKVDNAEADDCIAVISKYDVNDKKIYIISGDSDLWQLCNDNVFVVNPIKNNNLNISDIHIKMNKTKEGKKKISISPEKYLKMKILLGDKSDKISPVFNGCGPVMAFKLIENNELFQEIIMNKEENRKKYLHNKLLIDLSCIPMDIQEKIINKYVDINNTK